MILRPYQKEARDTFVREANAGVKRMLLSLPTATGKTVIFTHIDKVLRSSGETRPTLVIAHIDELLDQAERKFIEVDPTLIVSKEKAQLKAHPDSDIVVASIQSIGRSGSLRLSDFDFGLIIIDEAHHAAAESYKSALHRLGAFDGNRFIVGVTATPVRMDRKQLSTEQGAVFEKEIFKYSMRQAMRDGWISPIRGFRVETKVDISKVSVSKDFNRKELEDAIVGSNRNEIIFNKWKEVASTRKTLIFCVSVAHAFEVRDYYRLQDVKCDTLVASSKDREEINENFRNGVTQVMTAVRVPTEGWDIPDVSCIISAAPTMSWPLYVQEIGRGTRLAPGKEDLIVIDVVDNTDRHSLCTVPAILKLPKTIDLNGQTLEELAQEIEKVGVTDKSIIEKAAPRNIEELKSVLKKVELLSLVMTPEEIQDFTRYAWVPLTDGSYHLGCSKDRIAKFSIDTAGSTTVVMEEAGKVLVNVNTTMEPEKALPKFESYILKHWPEAEQVIKRDAHWWSEPCSTAQKRMLTSLGVAWKFWGNNLSKGHASRLIDYYLGQGKKPKEMSNKQKYAIRNKTRGKY